MSSPQPCPFSVLVADDEPAIRRLVEMCLTNAGVEVVAVPDGLAARRMLAERHFDTLVADLSMPDCDGHELVREARRSHPSLRIVAISGMNAAQLRVSLLLGADVALPKPFTASQLVEVVFCERTECLGDRRCASVGCRRQRAAGQAPTPAAENAGLVFPLTIVVPE